MNEFESMKKSASRKANERHAEVIRCVFGRNDICQNCSYPEHAKLFEFLVSRYEKACIKAHRVSKIFERGHSTNDAALRDVAVEKFALKDQLQPYRPCQDCIDRYNPTRKAAKTPYNLPRIASSFLDADIDGLLCKQVKNDISFFVNLTTATLSPRKENQ